MRFPKIHQIEQYISEGIEYLFWALEWAHWGVGVGWRKSFAFLTKWLGKLPWSCHFAIISAILCVIAANFAAFGGQWVIGWAELNDEHIKLMRQTGIIDAFRTLAYCFAAVSVILLLNAVFLSFVRCRLSLYSLKIGIAAFTVLWSYSLYALFRAPAVLHGTDTEAFGKWMRDHFVVVGTAYWIPVMVISLIALMCILLSEVRSFYGASRHPSLLALGDRVVKNLREHGQDPRFRTSVYWALSLHLAILVLPFLLHGCMLEPYRVPKGSGSQNIEQVKVKKVKKQKKERELILNMNSSIVYYKPDLDDSQISEQIEEVTRDTYKPTGVSQGKPGKGGGDEGGWPHGMEDAEVRFIRLEYRGGDWDQDMGKLADYNFLIKFGELTGFNIAQKTESIAIKDLSRFPEGGAPPFVFITGSNGINVSTREVKILREYLLERGGMIFADNGGGHFNRSFRRLMRRVLPENSFVDISNDDIIYRRPYRFPSGAPPLWHHSGRRALGMKHNGRWVVFYHQGDINDAWKAGHSGAEKLAPQAYRLGVNVVNYAFNQYMSIHYDD